MQQFVTSYQETPDVFPSVVSNDTKVLQLFISLSLATYKNCGELYKAGKRNNGVYSIDPDNTGAFDVYCDQKSAGGGWTVFQRDWTVRLISTAAGMTTNEALEI